MRPVLSSDTAADPGMVDIIAGKVGDLPGGIGAFMIPFPEAEKVTAVIATPIRIDGHAWRIRIGVAEWEGIIRGEAILRIVRVADIEIVVLQRAGAVHHAGARGVIFMRDILHPMSVFFGHG